MADTPREGIDMNDRSDAEWVTFQRIWSRGLGAWLLVQKRDGMTRTVATR